MTRSARGRHVPDPNGRPNPDAESDCLHDLLNLLAVSLERIRAGACKGLKWERWEDEEHIYVESSLPATSRPELDICIHDGKAIIRIER